MFWVYRGGSLLKRAPRGVDGISVVALNTEDSVANAVVMFDVILRNL